MLYSKGDTIEFKCYSNLGIVLEVMKRKAFFEKFDGKSCVVGWFTFYQTTPHVRIFNHTLVHHNVYYYVLIGNQKAWITDNMIKEIKSDTKERR